MKLLRIKGFVINNYGTTYKMLIIEAMQSALMC